MANHTNFKIQAPAGTSFLTPRDQEMARERARRRRMANLEDRELLRLELKDRWYIEKLHSFGELVVDHFNGGRELSGRDIQVIKTGADMFLKLLNKTLPDLKSVEKLGDPLDDGRDVTKMSTAELIALARQHEIPIEGEATVVEPANPPRKRGRPATVNGEPFADFADPERPFG